MIAACSRRAKTEAFHFPTVAMARANLREGVIWVVAPTAASTTRSAQEMADDYVRMGCAELKKMKLPAGNPNAAANKRHPRRRRRHVRPHRRARSGRDRLRRRRGREGRRARRLGGAAVEARAVPRALCRAAGHRRRRAGRACHARIRASPCTSTRRSPRPSGAPGRFKVQDRAGERRRSPTEEVGAIVQATGFSTYDIAKLPELGGGTPNVVDQAGLEALAQGRERRRRSGAPTAAK